jgi:hypothetical protein
LQWTWKWVIDSFLSFLTKYDERRAHNILSLMLGSNYKNLRLIFSFIGHKLGVVIRKEHDRRFPFFRVLKSYHCWKVKVISQIKMEKIIFLIFLKSWWALLNLWKQLSINNCENIKWIGRTSHALWSGGGNMDPRSQMLGF